MRFRRSVAGVTFVLALATSDLRLAVVAGQTAPAAVDVQRLGPQPGERVPEFTLPDQSGTMRTLRSVMGPNGAMLVFFRSADW